MAIPTRCASEDGDEVEGDDYPGEAIEENGASTKLRDQEPRETGTDEGNTSAAECDAIGRIGADAGLFEEVCYRKSASSNPLVQRMDLLGEYTRAPPSVT